jgi:hypothetical protein
MINKCDSPLRRRVQGIGQKFLEIFVDLFRNVYHLI